MADSRRRWCFISGVMMTLAMVIAWMVFALQAQHQGRLNIGWEQTAGYHTPALDLVMCLIQAGPSEIDLATQISRVIARIGCDAVRVVTVEPMIIPEFQFPENATSPSKFLSAGHGALLPLGVPSTEDDSEGAGAGEGEGEGEESRVKQLQLRFGGVEHPRQAHINGEGVDSATNLWQKTHHMFLYEYLHEYEGFEWFVHLDTDTLFVPSNFRRLAAQYSSRTRPAYLGHMLAHVENTTGRFNIGSCYAFNRAALMRLGPALQTEPECAVSPAANDWPWGQCLTSAGINVTATRDEFGREYFLPFKIDAHLHNLPYDEPEWYWHGKDEKNVMEESIAEFPVSVHDYKETSGMLYECVFGYGKETDFALSDAQRWAPLGVREFEARINTCLKHPVYVYPQLARASELGETEELSPMDDSLSGETAAQDDPDGSAGHSGADPDRGGDASPPPESSEFEGNSPDR